MNVRSEIEQLADVIGYTGSHFAAENIDFMYSLLESCKLNNVNFESTSKKYFLV